MKYVMLILSILGFLCVLPGCGSSKVVEGDVPEWVNKGSGLHKGDNGPAFYGVGAASNVNNIQLRRTAAETNARTDLARIFKTHVGDLVKIYARNVAGVSGDVKSNDEQFVQQTTKALTDMDLTGATIIDHYYSESSNTEYARAKMDPAQFKEIVDQMKSLSDDAKKTIEQNADKAFQELDAEVSKQKQ